MADVTVHDHHDPYDEGDVAALVELRSRGLTIRECARVLGRTTGGIRSKLYRLAKAARS